MSSVYTILLHEKQPYVLPSSESVLICELPVLSAGRNLLIVGLCAEQHEILQQMRRETVPGLQRNPEMRGRLCRKYSEYSLNLPSSSVRKRPDSVSDRFPAESSAEPAEQDIQLKLRLR